MIEKLGPFAEVLCFFGLVLVVLMAVGLFIFVYSTVDEWYDLKKRRWKDDHRFDKPPIGRCYCISCGNWIVLNTDKTSGYCLEWKKYTGDCEFCARSYKRTDNEYEKEQWRLDDIKEKEIWR